MAACSDSQENAEKWVLMLDNFLRVQTAWKGLCFVHPPMDPTAFAPEKWKDWPLLVIAGDQGSEGYSGYHALAYKEELLCNVWPWWEWSHGAGRDLTNTLEETGQMSFAMLTLILMNIRHGPDKDEHMRQQQFKAALKDMKETRDPLSFPLFLARAPAMLRELGDLVPIDESIGPIRSLWNWVIDLADNLLLGDRVKWSQYMAFMRGAEKLLQYWTFILFVAEYVGLEMDMLHGAKLMQVPTIGREVLAHNDAVQTTSLSATQTDYKILRAHGGNNVVTTVAVLSHYPYRRLLAHIFFYLKPVQRWQGLTAKAMKGVQANKAWFLGEFETCFYQLPKDLLATLDDQDAMRECGSLEPIASDDEELDGLVEEEDEWAELAGKLVLTLASKRIRRMLYCSYGWVATAFRCYFGTGGYDEAKAIMQEDAAAFNWARGAAGLGKEGKLMIYRSPFRTTPVKMLQHGFDATGPTARDDLLACLDGFLLAIMSSDMNELIQNKAKNAGQARGSKKYRRPERTMATGLASGILDTRFKIDVLKADVPLTAALVDAVPANRFGKDPIVPTVPIKGIATRQKQASYYSPQPENGALPQADLKILRDAHEADDVALLEKGFLNAFCCSDVHIVFRREVEGNKKLAWHMGLTYFRHSAAIAWPVSLEPVDGIDGRFVVIPANDIARHTLINVQTWDGLTCMAYKFRSWAWQLANVPAAAKWHPAIRIFTEGAEKSMLRGAADAAWWDLEIDALKQMAAEHSLCRNFEGDDELDLLFQMNKKVIKGSGVDTMRTLAPRLEEPRHEDPDAVNVLLQVDEAARCLMPDEEKKLRDKQDANVRKSVRARVMQGKFKNKFKAILAKVPPPAPARKKQKKGDTAPVTMPSVLDEYEHKDLKPYLPPEGLLWKSRTTNTWNIRMKKWPSPIKRKVTDKRPQTLALKLLFSEAWFQWSVLEGKDYADVPMQGLLPVEQALDRTI